MKVNFCAIWHLGGCKGPGKKVYLKYVKKSIKYKGSYLTSVAATPFKTLQRCYFCYSTTERIISVKSHKLILQVRNSTLTLTMIEEVPTQTCQ